MNDKIRKFLTSRYLTNAKANPEMKEAVEAFAATGKELGLDLILRLDLKSFIDSVEAAWKRFTAAGNDSAAQLVRDVTEAMKGVQAAAADPETSNKVMGKMLAEGLMSMFEAPPDFAEKLAKAPRVKIGLDDDDPETSEMTDEERVRFYAEAGKLAAKVLAATGKKLSETSKDTSSPYFYVRVASPDNLQGRIVGPYNSEYHAALASVNDVLVLSAQAELDKPGQSASTDIVFIRDEDMDDVLTASENCQWVYRSTAVEGSAD